jgi:hypothetical protein
MLRIGGALLGVALVGAACGASGGPAAPAPPDAAPPAAPSPAAGPTPEAMERVGDKNSARALAREAGYAVHAAAQSNTIRAVGLVAPWAQEPRLAITGWWHAKR